MFARRNLLGKKVSPWMIIFRFVFRAVCAQTVLGTLFLKLSSSSIWRDTERSMTSNSTTHPGTDSDLPFSYWEILSDLLWGKDRSELSPKIPISLKLLPKRSRKACYDSEKKNNKNWTIDFLCKWNPDLSRADGKPILLCLTGYFPYLKRTCIYCYCFMSNLGISFSRSRENEAEIALEVFFFFPSEYGSILSAEKLTSEKIANDCYNSPMACIDLVMDRIPASAMVLWWPASALWSSILIAFVSLNL